MPQGSSAAESAEPAGNRGCASSAVDGHLSLKTTRHQTHTSQATYNSESNANLGTICHLKSANPCNIGCSHVKQMGSGRAGCIDNRARSNFLSFNEGWSERLTKCRSLQVCFCVCVWAAGRGNVLVWWKGNLPSSISLDKLELLKAILLYCEFIGTGLNKESPEPAPVGLSSQLEQ